MKMLLTLAALLIAQPLNAQGSNAQAPPGAAETHYRLAGARALRPSRIWDDGYYTYIRWPGNAELPAVFSRGSDGSELIAEGSMIGDNYVLDRTHSLLIFRIDREVATARRQAGRHE